MIKLATETIDKSDIDKLIKWLKKNPKLTQGNLTKLFEKKFANWIGTKYAVFCNSGSSANLLMLSTLLELEVIKKNAKIVVPSICWSTDVAPIFQLNLNPILCDINLENLMVVAASWSQLLNGARKWPQPNTWVSWGPCGQPASQTVDHPRVPQGC